MITRFCADHDADKSKGMGEIGMSTEKIVAPTYKELWEEELEPVHRKDDASWRHGAYVTEVFHRIEDDTYWQADYTASTDGETNGLRQGDVTIKRVWPYREEVIAYTPTAPKSD